MLIFICTTAVGIAFNFIDNIYFKFTYKRSTFDIFDLVTTGDDTLHLIPRFLIDYWYAVLAFIAFLTALILAYIKYTPSNKATQFPRHILLSSLIFIISIGLCIIGIRGGFQLKPISAITAGEYTSAKNIPLVINTPFSIIKSYEIEKIEPISFFSEKQLSSYQNPYHKADTNKFKPLNVFVIILESFSTEYTGIVKQSNSYTPFFDSLCNEGLLFKNGNANGKKSMEALPAIIAGIPSLMNEPYITSRYGTNNVGSLPNLLKKLNYTSAFFHGATNGSMGFDAFAGVAGFDYYFGRKEYNNESDYDGSWGIWDEPFFLYTLQEINKIKHPFFVSLFSLSSHHPFKIPEKYSGNFTEGALQIHKTIRYSDYALRQFFNRAKKEPWFSNTLFVITADHTGNNENSFYGTPPGMYRVPILFYCESDPSLKRYSNKIVQHIDILPSVMDYLNYPANYFAYGNSAFSEKEAYLYSYTNPYFSISDSAYILSYDIISNTSTLVHYKTDSINKNNIAPSHPDKVKELEIKLKSMIQLYNNSLINNRTQLIEN